jgi:DNA-binding CsgD family transcriptional regulator
MMTSAAPFVDVMRAAQMRLATGSLRQDEIALFTCLAEVFPGVFAAALDAAGRFVWTSRSYAGILGIDPASLRGQSVTTRFPPAWARERMGVISRALHERTFLSTTEIFRGKRVEGAIIPVLDAQPTPVVIYAGRFGLGLARPGDAPVNQLVPLQLEEADWGPLSVLSRRELEVLRLIASGLDNGSIAKSIHRTKRAVEWHIKNLYAGLGCEQRTDLYRLGAQAGLPEIDDAHWDRMVAKVAMAREHMETDGEIDSRAVRGRAAT